MKAWGSVDGNVVAKTFELLFNAGRGEDQARHPDLRRRWQWQKLAGAGDHGAPFQRSPTALSWKVSLRSGSSTQ